MAMVRDTRQEIVKESIRGTEESVVLSPRGQGVHRYEASVSSGKQ